MKNLTSHSHPRSTLERTSERTGLIVSKHIIRFLRPVLGSPMPRVEKVCEHTLNTCHICLKYIYS